MVELQRSRRLDTRPPREVLTPDIVRFSERAREGLTAVGYTVFQLNGRMIWEMTAKDKNIICGVQTPEPLMMLRSRTSEVAIDLHDRVLGMWVPAYSDNSEHVQNKGRERVNRKIANEDFRSRNKRDRAFLEDIQVDIGTPADYIDLATSHLDSYLLGQAPSEHEDHASYARTEFITIPERYALAPVGPEFGWMPGKWIEPTRDLPARVAAVGDSKGNIVIYDFPVTDMGSSLMVYPLIVPKKTN